MTKKFEHDDRYEQFASRYDAILGDEHYATQFGYFDVLARQLPRGGRHLDIGCGTGALLAHSHSMGFQPHGLDISRSMVAEAKRRNPAIDIRAGSFMDHAPGKWHLITATNDVLNHLVLHYGINAVFERFATLLAPKGLVLTDVVTSYDIRNHWVHCNHVYSDGATYRCDVSHQVQDRAASLGRMQRRWSIMTAAGWTPSGNEVEVLMGLSEGQVRIAAERSSFSIETYDWDLGVPSRPSTSRLGVHLWR